MGSFERKLRRIHDQAAEEEAKGVDHSRLPVGKVVTEPVRGDFQGLPVLGWISSRAVTKTPLVMVALLLLRDDNPQPAGMLHLEIPVFPETEEAVVAALERLGWDGRVWPKDSGWPTGGPDEEGHKHLLTQTGLKGTMVFPPNQEGAFATLSLTIGRARGPFLMPPLPEPETPPSVHLTVTLRVLCEDWKTFYPEPKEPNVEA